MSRASRKRSKTFAWVTAILAMTAAIAVSSPAGAQSAPLWDGNPMRGAHEVREILSLLHDGIDGEVAEESFASTTGGYAGRLIDLRCFRGGGPPGGRGGRHVLRTRRGGQARHHADG